MRQVKFKDPILGDELIARIETAYFDHDSIPSTDEEATRHIKDLMAMAFGETANKLGDTPIDAPEFKALYKFERKEYFIENFVLLDSVPVVEMTVTIQELKDIEGLK